MCLHSQQQPLLALKVPVDFLETRTPRKSVEETQEETGDFSLIAGKNKEQRSLGFYNCPASELPAQFAHFFFLTGEPPNK